MTTIVDFVEDWIEIRAKLPRQLKLPQSGEMRTGSVTIGDTTDATLFGYIRSSAPSLRGPAQRRPRS